MHSTPLCPMKIIFLKSLIDRNGARTSLVLLASMISIWFALTPGAAQSKNQKRISSVQIGEASEGARVTVVSDSMLNDYEAFRRGDRFYVTIPQADFAAGKPGFRGDGFEDVQVQKVGDSVVFSFKLQPGATARVDQRSNRLDVIFSAPNRTERNRSNASRGAYVPTDGIVRVNNSQRVRPNQSDAAGPMPPDSPGTTATRERLATGTSSGFSSRPNTSVASNARDSSSRGSGNRLSGNTGSSTTRSGASSSASKTGSSPSASPAQTSSYSNVPSPTPSRLGSSPVVTPSASPNYPALATSTPSPLASQTATTSPGLASSQTWKNRSDLALQWVKANREATLIGGLLGLLLLVFLVAFLVRRRKNAGKSKRSGQTLAQPKPSADLAVNRTAVGSPVSSPPSNTSREFAHENTAGANERNSVAAPVASANGVRTPGIQENAERARLVQEPAFIPNKAQSAAVSPNHAWVRPSPSPGSSQDEDQEREVFEL